MINPVHPACPPISGGLIMSKKETTELLLVNDLEEMGRRAAEMIVQAGQKAIAKRGRYMLALSGGRTPKPIFQCLAMPPLSNELDWSRVYIFWTDERCVPPQHPDSNYGAAAKELLKHVPVKHVFRMRGELSEPELAALEYEKTLIQEFGIKDGGIPRFDLILLGLGEDGHVASLFPDSSALDESKRLAVALYVSQLKSYRLTLTLPVLNSARCCLFVVSGQSKREIFKRARNRIQDIMLPVHAVKGQIMWLVDNDAAGLNG
jgi:6-phosphogluconolactonase